MLAPASALRAQALPDSLGVQPEVVGGLPTSQAAARVQKAFETGDAVALMQPSAARVEISLFGARSVYSRSQGLYVLRHFFNEHAPQRFALQDLSCADLVCYVIGQYWHTRGERPLRAYVRLAASDATWMLREVRVEELRR
jgi:hypothetical protein